jgi:hypothetical protein
MQILEQGSSIFTRTLIANVEVEQFIQGSPPQLETFLFILLQDISVNE